MKPGTVIDSVFAGKQPQEQHREALGMAGKDIHIGVDILRRLALDDEFENASGQYFDNDLGQLASPHSDVLDSQKTQEVMGAIKAVLAEVAR